MDASKSWSEIEMFSHLTVTYVKAHPTAPARGTIHSMGRRVFLSPCLFSEFVIIPGTITPTRARPYCSLVR